MPEDTKKVLAIIPARYQSTRFPGKPLALLAEKPMVQHVYEQVTKVDLIHKVVVATDDQRIYDKVSQFGGNVVMTRQDHETGTDRMVEVVQKEACDWVLNVQGDEPLINPQDLHRLIQQTFQHQKAKLATLIFPIHEEATFQDPNVVKVVLNHRQEALYFSRAPIPFQKIQQQPPWKHIGVYLYQRDFLLTYNSWERSKLESTEQLEQLRILENGHSIFCVIAEEEGVGVDTPDDLKRAETYFQ